MGSNLFVFLKIGVSTTSAKLIILMIFQRCLINSVIIRKRLVMLIAFQTQLQNLTPFKILMLARY
jgi:Na+-transporting NADH:ubiquinone oxidoreductase subunit NqrC